MITSSHINFHKTGIEKETSSNLARGSQQGKPARDKPVRSNTTSKVGTDYDVPYENLGSKYIRSYHEPGGGVSLQ